MKKIFLLILIVLMALSAFNQKIHIVKKGDTLWDLAGYYYNNPFLWRNIYNANMDKIEDPHWIYPGQEFIIPDIPADMTVTTDTEIIEQDIVIEDTREPKDIILKKEETKDKSIEYKKMDKEQSFAKITQIREDIKKVERSKTVKIQNSAEFAVAKKLAFIAGYITPDNPAIGKIGDLFDNSHLYTKHEKCYIKLNPDIQEDLTGKEFIIYRWNNSVSTPEKEYLGKHVYILGTIKINGYEDEIAYGTITGSFNTINKGDYIAFYSPPTIPINNAYLREPDDIRAHLIGKTEKNLMINEFSIVFIDIGKEKNINHGDVFTIIRKNKANNLYAVGALQVLVPYEGYSTATVISIKGNMDITPPEEIKLSYRNKNAYILNQYKKLNELQAEQTIEKITDMEETTEQAIETEPIQETEEEIIVKEKEETLIEETEETTIEEPTIEEEIITEEPEDTTTEEFVIEEETVIEQPEDTTTEEFVIEEETVIEQPEDTTTEEFIIEEESVKDTDEGFLIEEEPEDTIYNDSIIIEGEDEIIIIE